VIQAEPDSSRTWDAFHAFMRGELSSEEYAQLFDPGVEVRWNEPAYPDTPQELHGREDFIAFAEQYRDGWEDLAAEILETTEIPGHRILELVRQSGRGRQSGAPIVIHFFQLSTLKDGKLTRIEYYRHRVDAMRAAGLA
jgi:ketosteroid isomerase-like protein